MTSFVSQSETLSIRSTVMNGDRQLYALFFFTFKPRDKNISDILHASTPAGNLLSFYQMSHLPIDTWSEMLLIFNGLWLLVLWPLQVYYWYGNAVVFVTCSDIDNVLIFGDFAVSNSPPHILFCTCSPIPSLKDVLDWSLLDSLFHLFYTGKVVMRTFVNDEGRVRYDFFLSLPEMLTRFLQIYIRNAIYLVYFPFFALCVTTK